jgi:uracil-DNA glycosylase family 4
MHLEAKHVGNPTEWHEGSLLTGPVVVFVGQNPGEQENARGPNEPHFFIGPAGQMLTDIYIGGINLLSRAVVYKSNGLRCGPRSVTNPPYFNHCVTHLLNDLELILAAHRGHPVLVVFVSAPAVTAFWKATTGEKVTQSESFSRQGRVVKLTNGEVVVFSTFHPAALLRDSRFKRGSDKILAVREHLEIISRYLAGESSHQEVSAVSPDTFDGYLKETQGTPKVS